MPGLGTFSTVRLTAASSAVGKSLAELNLRAQTGASVLAITRKNDPIVAPTAKETLHAGDILTLTGTQVAIQAAQQQL